MYTKMSCSVDTEYAKLKLGDLSAVSTLGVGGFGRVELVSLFTHVYIHIHTFLSLIPIVRYCYNTYTCFNMSLVV